MKRSVKSKAVICKAKPTVEVVEAVEAELYKRVRSYIAKARAKVYTVANKEMVAAYWNVGREIVEKQGGAERAKYGDGLIKGLSLKLTAEFGPGFDVANLRNMRQFFLVFGKRYTLCSELNWSHYRTLMCIENDKKRQFYFEEWCFFLVDLKVGKITPEDIGQMQLYKHYYEREMMNPGDNPPVGIVLGSERDEAVIRYTLNEHERNLFAVKYHLTLPTEEELQLELQRERAVLEETKLLSDSSTH